MTGAEMERAIGFLLESHASLTVKIEQLVESQSRTDVSIARVEAFVEHLATSVERLEVSVVRVVDETSLDRAEIRTAVNTMLSFAESMADNVRLLTEAQLTTTNRVRQVEARLDTIESSEG